MADENRKIISKSIGSLHNAADRLLQLHNAAITMGNVVLANTFFNLRSQIVRAANDIREADLAMLNERFEESQQATGNIINAALAVAERKA